MSASFDDLLVGAFVVEAIIAAILVGAFFGGVGGRLAIRVVEHLDRWLHRMRRR